jgi:Protein of unknown function (DUF1176)
MRLALALFTIILNAAPGCLSAQSITQDYGSWTLTCNNVKTCVALTSYGGYSPPNAWQPSDPNYSRNINGFMMITREAGPDAQPVLSIMAPGYKKIEVRETAIIRLIRADGSGLGEGPFPLRASPDGRNVLETSQITAFLNSSLGAVEAVVAENSDDEGRYLIRLNSLFEVAQAIDTHQGRTGTTTALVAIGPNLPQSIPIIPSIPVVTAQPLQRQEVPRPSRAITTRITTDCRTSLPQYRSGERAFGVLGLAGNRRLWVAQCGLGGYNVPFRLYIEDAQGRLIPARFTGKTPPSTGNANIVFNPDFDPARGLVTFTEMQSERQDCGTSETFAWTGSIFTIVAQSAMINCYGVPKSDWPSTLVSQVAVLGSKTIPVPTTPTSP